MLITGIIIGAVMVLVSAAAFVAGVILERKGKI